MKVVFVAHSSDLDGAGRSLFEMVLNLRAVGVRPYVVIAMRRGKNRLGRWLAQEGVPYSAYHCFHEYKVERLDGTWMRIPFRWTVAILRRISEWRIYRLLKRERPDLLHINAAVTRAGLQSAKALGIPVVWHVREDITDPNLYDMENLPMQLQRLASADCVIGNAAYTAEVYRKYLPNRVVWVPNAVEMDDLMRIKQTHRILEKQACVITLVGGVPRKNHLDALAMMAGLRENGYDDVTLRIVGSISEAYMAVLTRYISEHELSEKVVFTGYCDDAYQIYADSDICLACGTGVVMFCRVAVEAMAAGALVIASNMAGMDAIVPEGCGLTYLPADVKDFTAKVIFALENRDAARELAENGSRFAVETYSPERNTQGVLAVYEDVLARTSSASESAC